MKGIDRIYDFAPCQSSAERAEISGTWLEERLLHGYPLIDIQQMATKPPKKVKGSCCMLSTVPS